MPTSSRTSGRARHRALVAVLVVCVLSVLVARWEGGPFFPDLQAGTAMQGPHPPADTRPMLDPPPPQVDLTTSKPKEAPEAGARTPIVREPGKTTKADVFRLLVVRPGEVPFPGRDALTVEEGDGGKLLYYHGTTVGGMRQGLWTQWDPSSGALLGYARYDQGRQVGHIVGWWPNGQLRAYYTGFKDRRLAGKAILWDQSGAEVSRISYDEDGNPKPGTGLGSGK
jgi:hypothetical protein